MTDDQERRLSALEQAVSDIRVEQAELRSAITANAAVTNAVKADTAEVVHLLKGGRVFGKVVAWTAGMGAMLYAIRDWVTK